MKYLLAFLILTSSIQAADVRYEWLNSPADQEGHDVTGYVVVKVSGSGIPGRAFVGSEHITDWRIKCGDMTISRAAVKDGNGVSMRNQGYGNYLLATDKGLYMQGAVGSRIELQNIVGGTPPYTSTVSLVKAGKSVSDGDKWENRVEYKFHFGKYPKWNYVFDTLKPHKFDSIKTANLIQIGTNPRINDEPQQPTPAIEIKPDPKPSPVGPSELSILRERITDLESRIAKLEGVRASRDKKYKEWLEQHQTSQDFPFIGNGG